ncbi:MAG: hypothetical protein BAJALOKI1v1_80030 [Promethearchaeota archaeon]|nr:MAG: hypothetical protein BAJALOKI1v1_80030 [Candidatus Lokiarchaeota archaeon]
MPSKSKKINLKKSRIRAFFNSLSPQEDSDVQAEELKKIEKEGMPYIQLRLPVKEITPEFENKITQKVEHNVIKAQIREAEFRDLKTIKEIHDKAWLTSNTPFRAIDIDTLEIIFEDKDTIFLIAKVYGRDAGFIILDSEEEGKVGTIAALGVLPNFQRKGLGLVLGMAGWNYFKKHHPNIEELRAEVYEKNKVSYNFIKALGFNKFDVKHYKKEDFEL